MGSLAYLPQTVNVMIPSSELFLSHRLPLGFRYGNDHIRNLSYFSPLFSLISLPNLRCIQTGSGPTWRTERCREAPLSQLRSKVSGAGGCLPPSRMVAGRAVDLGGLRFGFHEGGVHVWQDLTLSGWLFQGTGYADMQRDLDRILHPEAHLSTR